MIKQGFHIGDRDWWVMVYYDVCPSEISEIEETVRATGASEEDARRACDNLMHPNTGLTITDYASHTTFMAVSRATSSEQMFDTIVHELKHLTEHISNYYGLDPKTEISAYLQGEVGRNMWCAAAMVLCPGCEKEREV